MGLDEEIISVIREAGHAGATASQIARKLGKKREVISHYLWILKKMGRATNSSRNLWVLTEKGLDPFNTPLKDFEKLTFDEYISLSEKAYELCEGKIKEAFKDDSIHHVVICNGEIINKSSNIAGVASHVIRDLVMKRKKPCYIFSREDMVEEARWNKLDDDYYPTLVLLLGGERWNDKTVAGEGREICHETDNMVLRDIGRGAVQALGGGTSS